MKWLARWRGLLEGLFTPKERVALVFLMGSSFLGLGLLAWEKGHPAALPIEPDLVVYVNSALLEELKALPGIGPVTAQRIVAYRKEHGRFLTLSDLTRVKGITPKTLAKLKGLLRFD